MLEIIWFDSIEVRDVLFHVLDYLDLFGAGISGEIFNIGPDEEFVSINELAMVIAELLDFPLQPVYMPDRPQEVKLANCSADKIRAVFGYQTRYSLKEGIQEMIAYIREHGVKPFCYHIDLEINNEKTPLTWKKQLF